MKRYTPYFTTEDTQPLYAMREKAEGLYVLYSDAQAEIARLREAPDYGELWSFLRAVLSQGGDIYLDHCEKSYEQYSARLDAAAQERLAKLRALIDERKDAQERA